MSYRADVYPYDPKGTGPKPPGLVLFEWLEKHHRNGMWLAKQAGWADSYPSRLRNNRSRIGPVTAVKIAKATATKPAYWLDLQARYDAWEAAQRASEPDPMDVATDALVAELAALSAAQALFTIDLLGHHIAVTQISEGSARYDVACSCGKASEIGEYNDFVWATQGAFEHASRAMRIWDGFTFGEPQ